MNIIIGAGKLLKRKSLYGSGKDIGRRLIGHILRDQIFLTNQEFEHAARENLTAEDYRRILEERGLLREEE